MTSISEVIYRMAIEWEAYYEHDSASEQLSFIRENGTCGRVTFVVDRDRNQVNVTFDSSRQRNTWESGEQMRFLDHFFSLLQQQWIPALVLVQGFNEEKMTDEQEDDYYKLLEPSNFWHPFGAIPIGPTAEKANELAKELACRRTSTRERLLSSQRWRTMSLVLKPNARTGRLECYDADGEEEYLLDEVDDLDEWTRKNHEYRQSVQELHDACVANGGEFIEKVHPIFAPYGVFRMKTDVWTVRSPEEVTLAAKKEQATLQQFNLVKQEIGEKLSVLLPDFTWDHHAKGRIAGRLHTFSLYRQNGQYYSSFFTRYTLWHDTLEDVTTWFECVLDQMTQLHECLTKKLSHSKVKEWDFQLDRSENKDALWSVSTPFSNWDTKYGDVKDVILHLHSFIERREGLQSLNQKIMKWAKEEGVPIHDTRQEWYINFLHGTLRMHCDTSPGGYQYSEWKPNSLGILSEQGVYSAKEIAPFSDWVMNRLQQEYEKSRLRQQLQ